MNPRAIPAYLKLIQWIETEPMEDSLRQQKIEDLFQQALLADGGHPVLRYAYGQFLWDRKLPDSAIVHFELALDFSPTYPEPRVARGIYLQTREKFGQAQRDFQVAISLLQGVVGAPFAELALNYYYRGKDDSAGIVLDHCRNLGERSPKVKFVEALLWEVTENLEIAKTMFEELIEEDSSNSRYQWALNTLGKKSPRSSLTEMLQPIDRDWEEATVAIEILDPLVKKYPDNPAIWFALGQAYMERDLNAHAIHAFDFALAIDPGMADVSEFRKRALEKLEGQGIALPGKNSMGDTLQDVPGGSAETDSTGFQVKVDLGHYLVPWGSSISELNTIYGKDFESDAPDRAVHEFTDNGLLFKNTLGFRENQFRMVLVEITDTTGSSGDLFGNVIGWNTKISGNGRSTGTGNCPEEKGFQGVLWENEDTVELLIQKKGTTDSVYLLRLGKGLFNFPEESRLCTYAQYFNFENWDKDG